METTPKPRKSGTTYAVFSTRHLIDLLKQQHGLRPAFDGKGRLVLLPAVFHPAPVALQLELRHRREEVRAILEAGRPKARGEGGDASA